LYKAEWLKLSRIGTARLVALILLAMTVLIPLVAVVNTVGTGPLAVRQDNFFRLSFLQAIRVGQDALSNVGIIIVIVLVSVIIGNEYDLDTWKNLLTRQNGRIRFLVAKLIVIGIVFLIAALLTLALTQLMSTLGYLLVKEPALKAGLVEQTLTPEGFFTSLLANGVEQLLYFTVIGVLATLFTIIGRGSIAGIITSLFWWIADTFSLKFLPDYLAMLTVDKNLNSLKQNLIQNGTGTIPMWQSLLFIALYIIGVLAAAFIIFQRRDVNAGNG
jgi:ABC-type transport system involved in multi-copper enzyme maturation permease subunit